MKTLLVTNIPPCKNIATGMVLDRLCRMFKPGTLACFSISDPKLGLKNSSDLDWIPARYYDRPREYWRLLPSVGGGVLSWTMEQYRKYFLTPVIVNEAAKFAREFGADRIWCILDGQTTMRLALPLAKKLDLPLHVQVWDPPQGILRSKELDSCSFADLIGCYNRTLKECESCAAISRPMAKDYQSRYGTKTVILFPGRDPVDAIAPASSSRDENDILIGLGGQMYCPEAWDCLLKGLAESNWKILGKPVRLSITGRKINLQTDSPVRIEYLGWQSDADSVRRLAECDVLYCPYWFDPAWDEQIRQSFPSKLTTMLMSGRPVIFHGPEYASPSEFLREENAGLCCHSLEPAGIIGTFEKLLSDRELYRQLSTAGREAFDRYLALAEMKTALAEFLGISSDDLRQES